jgi:glycosyltransferase involved in cell wall biosynthesis
VTLALACPVYNEADNIGHLLDVIDEKIHVPAEVVIVYDFEEDSTLPVVRERMASYRLPIRLQRNAYGRGAMNAVKTGLETSSHHAAVAVIMADLSDDLGDIDTMYAKIADGTLDVVCGSRYMRGGRQVGGPVLKTLLSRLAGLSLRLFARIPTHDATNNFKMYRGSFIAATRIESQAGFEIGLEMVAKAFVGGYRIGEIPTTWHDRVAGESRFDLVKWLPQYLRWYFYAFRPRAAQRKHPAPISKESS